MESYNFWPKEQFTRKDDYKTSLPALREKYEFWNEGKSWRRVPNTALGEYFGQIYDKKRFQLFDKFTN